MKIYYHNDLDGKCAAAITFRNIQGQVELIEVDYKDKIDIKEIVPGECIYILDFSFKPEVMEQVLRKTIHITWLDHHETAFTYPYNYPEFIGIRDKNYSGCELAWRWYYGTDSLVPRAVTFIGDYDKWALKLPECFEFYEGLKLEDTNPRSKIWDKLLSSLMPPLVSKIIYQGQFAIKYRDNYCANIRKDFGYEVEWYGYLAYATNFYQFGSKGFREKFNEYDFVIAYIHDGNRFTVSLYSEKVDISVICKEQGGGGHPKAAGFVCNQLPFKRKE